MPGWCSVENLYSSEDHDVKSQDSQEDFAALGPVFARSQGCAEQAFEHTMNSLHLPSLAVSGQVQPGFHLSSPVAAGRLFGRATNQGGDQRSHPERLTGEAMSMLAVVACVGGQGLDLHASPRFAERALEVLAIGARTAFRHHGQHKVRVGVAQHTGLGKITKGGFFPGFRGRRAAFHVVLTDVPRLEARAIQGRQRNATWQSLLYLRKADRLIQKPLRVTIHKQPRGRLLKRGEMGHLRQVNHRRQLAKVLQQRRQLAIVELQKLLEHQAGKQLRLRVCLGTKAVRVVRQDKPADKIRQLQYSLGRLAGLHLPGATHPLQLAD